MNLLQETEETLTANNKTWDDVLWIGGAFFTISINDFKTLANHSYDNGFGAPEVAMDLKVVGKDWWLERDEYDGSECWAYKTYPKKPLKQKSVKRLFHSDGWQTLDEMQSNEDNDEEE